MTAEDTVPAPQVLIFATHDELYRVALAYFERLAGEAVGERGRFLVALSGGGTPQPLYRRLATRPGRLPWSHTHVLWGDERCVPPDDEGSNARLARQLLLDHVPLPAGNVHRVKGELACAAAAADYAQQLAALAADDRDWPRLDLALMGLGRDGHTASLFPGPIAGAETTQPTLAVTAEYEGRPAGRVTLTPPVFNDARQVIFLVTGAGKADALHAVLTGADTPEQWPAQRIRPGENAVLWLVDAAAAQRLTD